MNIYINGKNINSNCVEIVLPQQELIIPQKIKKVIYKSNTLSQKIKLFSAAGLVGLDSGFNQIIVIFKDFAYYVALAYCIWGVIEYILERPGATEKIKKSFYGYIGINIIPYIFKMIRMAFQGL